MAKGGKRPGAGRPKGVPNKVSGAVKDMILQAVENKGGVAYFERQADENPNAFMSLVGKTLPLQVTGEDGKGIPVAVTFTITQAPNSENQT